jgi:phage N-6-adenine-methyltransferase
MVRASKKKTGASLARHASSGNYATPVEFVDAVKRRFGIAHFAWDLAASEENTKADRWYDERQDSLKQDWTRHLGDSWLNPPYGHIEPWAAKCHESFCGASAIRRLFLLVPAAVGSNWFANHVDARALVLLLNGRICFDGKNPYPKDTILACYGLKPGYAVWRWKDQP